MERSKTDRQATCVHGGPGRVGRAADVRGAASGDVGARCPGVAVPGNANAIRTARCRASR